MSWWKMVRAALFFGACCGLLVSAVQTVAILLRGDSALSGASGFVATMLSFLVLGGAGRLLAVRSRAVSSGWQVGGLAGGISEFMHYVVTAAVLTFSPQGQAIFAHLTPEQQSQASDIALGLVELGVTSALGVLFGAGYGWLGAWSALRLKPPEAS
jgi:hypothetical protein